MIANIKKAEKATVELNLPSSHIDYTVVNSKKGNLIDNKSKSRSKKCMASAILKIKTLADFQVDYNKLENMPYNDMILMSISEYSNFVKEISIDEEVGLRHLKNSVYILAKLQKSEMFDDYIAHAKKAGFDKTILDILLRYQIILGSIEEFQSGLWLQAANTSTKFLKTPIMLNLNNWLREFERACYISIANYCANRNDTYLPINAMNYVHPQAQIPLDMESDPFESAMYFERKINLQETTNEEFNKTMVTLLKIFGQTYMKVLDSHEYMLRSFLLCIYNIIGTLVSNTDKFSNDLLLNIGKIVEIVSESDYVDQDNANKFSEYFGTSDIIQTFRAEFYEISDAEKNDTLYYDVAENADNQYFVLINLTPVSEDPHSAVMADYTEFMNHKNIKTMANRRLAR